LLLLAPFSSSLSSSSSSKTSPTRSNASEISASVRRLFLKNCFFSFEEETFFTEGWFRNAIAFSTLLLPLREVDDDGGEEGRGDQLTHAIALDASFADAIREAYTTAGALLNDLGENFKIRQTPPVGAFALFFALSKCARLSLYGFPSPDSNRLETQPYWPRKTKTDGKPTKVDVFGDRVFYALVRLLALEGFVDVVN